MSVMRRDSCKQSSSSSEHFLPDWRVMRILVAGVILAGDLTMIILLSITIWHNESDDWPPMSAVPSPRWPLTSTYCLPGFQPVDHHDFTESWERERGSRHLVEHASRGDWWWTLWGNAMVNIKMRVQLFIFTFSVRPHTTNLYCRLEN